MIYITGFSISLGPLTWIYTSDILPQLGVSLATTFNLIFTAGVAFGFPMIENTWNVGTAFIIFGICSIIGLGFVYKFLVESKNKSMEDIWKEMGIAGVSSEKQKLLSDKNYVISGIETNDFD